RLIAETITEWQPPSIRHLSGVLLFASVALVIGLIARRGRAVTWPIMAWLGVFLALALWAERNAMWWALALPPAAAAILADPSPPPRREYPALAVNNVLAGVFAILVLVLFPWPWVSGHLNSRLASVRDAPTALTAAARHAFPTGARIFDAEALGSWLEF